MAFKILFFIAGFALWLWAIVDILQSDFKDSNMKLVWMLVVLLMPMLGTILYMWKAEQTKVSPVQAPEPDTEVPPPPEAPLSDDIPSGDED